ncbi:copper chaperone PCu(A)C [Roseibium aestuarii]|uniref:Copper chaperone PCu(A)C n=1 Tax=Roseibium aestuarii TaxID=2600299 RepID=A0ABW4JSV0_9HYPH|nr:copper chaperone PCu(A)C [Roseibium aestuarii]
MKSILLAAIAAITLSTAALAEPVQQGSLVLDHAWTRATPPAARAGGGFVEITNSGSEADRLVSAASPAANRVELHEMSMKDGVMVMRQKTDGIELPAGETVALAPGGLHIMFMELTGPFKQGETVPVTLTFEKAGAVTFDLSVEKIGAKGMAGHMDHGQMGAGQMDHGKMGQGHSAHTN